MSKTAVNYDSLFEDYLANRLTAEGVVEIKRVLASDKAMRARFVAVLQEWELMSEAARQVTANSSAAIVERLEADSSNREITADLNNNSRRRPSLRVAPTRPQTRRAISMLLPAAALAASIAMVLMLTGPTAQEQPLATMTTSTGQVIILRAKQQLVGKIGTPLFAGDRLQVSDGAFADIYYPDQTALHIDQRSDVQLAATGSTINKAGKRVILTWGRVSAEVTKQPVGQPMLFVTPNAQAEVLGTALTLEFSQSLDATRLEVDHGLVAITDLNKKQRVEVPTGHYATVTDKQLPVARLLVHRPIEVTKDYRPGLRATYYAGGNFNAPLFDRIEPTISADLGLEARVIDQRQSDFNVRWDGYLQPIFSEKYLFTLRCDAGVRMYVDEKLVIDAWGATRIAEHQTSLKLDASKRHQIRVEYRQPKSGMLIRLSWASLSQNDEVIPVERFSTDK
jgi:hypothetical protein